MPRRKQDEVVAERAQQILAEKGQRRKQGAEKAAQTRRQGRQAAEPAPQDQTPKTPATRAKQEPKERKPRVHADLLTVAFRGPLAGHFRELAEQHHMSLSALLQDDAARLRSQRRRGVCAGDEVGGVEGEAAISLIGA